MSDALCYNIWVRLGWLKWIRANVLTYWAPIKDLIDCPNIKMWEWFLTDHTDGQVEINFLIWVETFRSTYVTILRGQWLKISLTTKYLYSGILKIKLSFQTVLEYNNIPMCYSLLIFATWLYIGQKLVHGPRKKYPVNFDWVAFSCW